ncbi:restriction endonuclease subunit S [Streptomyces fradiae]|uniref:restriction endonuclease subunit S n=1 Tax=Streptomyces fradiae TaxID=1906 RepID=UPI003987819A
MAERALDVANLPRLPKDWSYEALEDLLEPGGISYGIVQPGSPDPDGIPIVRVKDLKGGRVVQDDPLQVSSEIEEKYSRTRLRGGEVLISLVGSVGETAVAAEALSGWNVARAIGVLRVSHRVSAKWLKTCLGSEVAQQYMHTRLNTTVQATLNLRDVRRIPVVMPPDSERAAIAGVLGALDDKIAANEAVAATAEALLRARYDLFGARAGRTVRIDGLGHLIRDTVQPDGLSGVEPYIGLEHMPRKSIWLHAWGQASEVGSIKTSFDSGDILFGKLRPYFCKVGLARVAGICSTDILVVRARKSESRTWLLLALSSDEVIDHATARSEGTRMPRAKWSDLAEFEIPFPDVEALARFEELASPLVERAELAGIESRSLAALRDTLLPELMSGKLRVRDAERIVEDAV